MRLDKYLKVSRLIKRRTVANEACDNERVSVNGRVQRASYDVKVGDRISIRFGPKELQVEVELSQRIDLTGRERLTVTGVEDVERFDELSVVMRTAAGVLVVTGEDLHIGKLSLDGGELLVEGHIDGLNYEDAPVRKGSFFSRLLG